MLEQGDSLVTSDVEVPALDVIAPRRANHGPFEVVSEEHGLPHDFTNS
jgi:hypothetical protein